MPNLLIFFTNSTFNTAEAMRRILVNTYDSALEIAIFVNFLIAGILGWMVAEVFGAALAVGICFVLLIFAVAPLAMLSDIRKSLMALEKAAGQGGGTTAEDRRGVDVVRVNTSAGPKQPDRIKVYKGFEIMREATGVNVNGTVLPNVIAAERWINEEIKKNPG